MYIGEFSISSHVDVPHFLKNIFIELKMLNVHNMMSFQSLKHPSSQYFNPKTDC